MELTSVVSLVAGLALLVVVLSDLFATVFLLGGGGGRQTSFVATRMWQGALWIHERRSEGSHSRLRAAGPLILLSGILLWIVELTLAWALIHVPEAFDTAEPIAFHDRLVFAAGKVVGRGRNEVELLASDGVWDALGSVAGATGVVIISMTLAYVLPVLDAVTQKRSAASHMHTLGNSVAAMRDMVARSEGGGEIAWHLETLTVMIVGIAERHRAYPVLHYFHSRDPHAALALGVARVTGLVRGGLPGASSVDATVLWPLARALHDLLGAVQSMGLGEFADSHPELDQQRLHEVGIEPLSEPVHEPPSREWIKAYVLYDGWDWQLVADDDVPAFDDA